MRLIYFTAEQWPTFRPDLVALFGKYLPRRGVTCDLVTERERTVAPASVPPWGGGRARLCNVPANRAGQYVAKLWHNLSVLASTDARRYDAIQVRDMSLTALFGLMMARLKGLRFFYWLSYPQSEGQIDRARARGLRGGMRFWFPLIQGMVGRWILYGLVLPRADHVFVQSRQMQLDLAKVGVPMDKMTPVPMGVDVEAASHESLVPVQDGRLENRRVVAYLGTLDRVRRIEILLHMLAIVLREEPEVLLMLVGDTEDAAHRAWLKNEAERLGVADHVLWTGWLPGDEAWGYVRRAEVGLSPFPRSFLLDSASPTKAVEYMALGLPVVVNDNPDQAQVVAESGGGLCVSLEPQAFADAVTSLLRSPETRRVMGERGRAYVRRVRCYDNIAEAVARVYRELGDAIPAVGEIS
ncbi:MAG TPA: glycosyltransferase [Burkholderiaceae bacterium]